VGPIKNGGIGTHCYHLAKFLRQELGHEVTILFTGSVSKEALRRWKKRYFKEWGIRLVGLKETVGLPQIRQNPPYPVLRHSLQVYEWLKQQDFDFCHFEDWQPEGFMAIQSKRTGQAFSNTSLIFTMHSSAKWAHEATQDQPNNRMHGLAHNYMTRYCAQHADLLLSPSQYMFDWAQSHQWELQVNRRVVPLLFELPFEPQPKPFARRHLIFFGRLESRKGLAIFVKALEALAPYLRNTGTRLQVSFLGRASTIDGQSAPDYLASAMRPVSDAYDWRVISDFDQPEALRFVTVHADALVVVPSLSDNSPYTVIECLQMQSHLIAARVGGIPELVNTPANLFEPTADALGQKLLECLRDGIPKARGHYDAQVARQAWRRVHELGCIAPAAHIELRAPKVSVCVAHRNHGQFLPQALEALANQTYSNYEVIVVDDESTDPRSLSTFRDQQKKQARINWRFLEKEHGYLGQTRNFAARQATGDLLVFADADNISTPQMLDRMVRGMEASGAACLTCHCLTFTREMKRRLRLWRNRFTPVGPCLELAIYKNLIGDANFIVRRDVFERMGGFTEDRDVGCQDWEFLLKLVVNGLQVDVIPEVLFHYRHSPTSMANTMNRHVSHQLALRPVLAQLAPPQQRVLINAVDAFRKDSIAAKTCPSNLGDSAAFRDLDILHTQLEQISSSPVRTTEA
jgi:glycosyltransferase involved in cell wall biosynthesis/GT2 family glycosyltransferase